MMRKDLVYLSVADIHQTLGVLRASGVSKDCIYIIEAMLSGIIVKEGDRPDVISLQKDLDVIVRDIVILINNSSFNDKVIAFNENADKLKN